MTLSPLLPRSRLLTLDGWGHTSLFESSCIDAKVSDYLLTSRVPRAGTVCRPDLIPFTQPAAAATTAATPSGNALLVPEILRRARAVECPDVALRSAARTANVPSSSPVRRDPACRQDAEARHC